MTKRRINQWIRRHVHRLTRIDARRISFTPDETILLELTDGRAFTMRIGSDDDVYHFINDADPKDIITFPVQE